MELIVYAPAGMFKGNRVSRETPIPLDRTLVAPDSFDYLADLTLTIVIWYRRCAPLSAVTANVIVLRSPGWS